jgi:hypothetical protein
MRVHLSAVVTVQRYLVGMVIVKAMKRDSVFQQIIHRIYRLLPASAGINNNVMPVGCPLLNIFWGVRHQPLNVRELTPYYRSVKIYCYNHHLMVSG